METYKNLSGDSGVIAYEIGSDSIIVYFKYGVCYLYESNRLNPDKIKHMQALAQKGEGLSTFISQNRDVYEGYSEKYKYDQEK